MIVVLVVVAVVLLFLLRGRHKRVAARADGLLISREDRTASFARGPRRFRQRGHLALPIVPLVLAPGPFHQSAGVSPLHETLIGLGGSVVVLGVRKLLVGRWWK